MRIGVVGFGTVGKAMHKMFPGAEVYDPFAGLGTRAAINACDAVFICVPTPNPDNDTLDTSIVEEVVAWVEAPLLILRSTVNPGTTTALARRYGKRIVFQPEYLGETAAHPLADPKHTGFLILGGEPEDVRQAIIVYQTAYNASVRIRQMDSTSAEVIKLAENRAIAHKVGEAQELYDLCEACGVDYYLVREAVYQDDPRMSPFWTFIYPEQRGFQSKCIPKDVYAIASFARAVGAPLEVTESVLRRNEEYLRFRESDHSRRNEVSSPLAERVASAGND